jgi:hypothetical protein
VLGVRREGITDAVGKLQKRGVIHYVCDQITVRASATLERLACEFYAAVKKETDCLLGAPITPI